MADLMDYVGTEIEISYSEGGLTGRARIVQVEGDNLIAVAEESELVLILSPLWDDVPVGDSPLIGVDEHDLEIQSDPV